jgi:hypothetical protein
MHGACINDRLAAGEMVVQPEENRMTRYIKALGLALVAVFAMTAVMASAAHAAQGKFTPTESKQLTASQDDAGGQNTATGLQSFKTTSGTVSCDEVSGTALVTPGSQPVEVTAEKIKYNDTGLTTCKGPFSTKPTIEFKTCDYLFTAGETLGTSDLTVQPHIVCQGTDQITISAPFCQIHVPKQSPKGHIIFKNVAGINGKTHITGEATVSEIKYQGTELCSSGTDGTYTGNITVKGYKAEPHNATQEESIHVH